MFCSQCGTQMDEADRFCAKCGKSTTTVPVSVHAQKASSFEREVAAPLSFGVPENRWWLPFKGKAPFPAGYEWLEQRNTLLVR